jgi:hypothetical protein
MAKSRHKQIQQSICDIADNEKQISTLKGFATSVSKFFEMVTTLEYNILMILHCSLNTSDERGQNFLSKLLFAYMADVQTSHKKHTTCKTYASQVNNFWHIMTKVFLWSKMMMASTDGFVHSLKKTKRFESKPRLGLCSADIIVLISTMQNWVSYSRPINDRGSRDRVQVWTIMLFYLLSAQYAFVFCNVMRFGESDDPGGSDFDFLSRINRSDVTIYWENDIRYMSLADPLRKSMNSTAGKAIKMCFNSDPLNWPTLVERYLLLDVVHPAHLKTTPLFRDVRGLVPSGGFFPPSSKVMTSDWNLRILRKLIVANPVHFANRLAADGTASTFGLHSLKIGVFNEMLDLGSGPLVASTIGRWDGASFVRYHRVSQQEEHEWSHKVSQGHAKPKQQ